jgi:hypothetical protein
MAKMFSKTARKLLSPKPAARQADRAYPVEQEDLEEQHRRLRKAAAAGADALRTPAPPAPAEQPPVPAKAPSKPLTPLAALWPDQVPSKGESRPSQAPKTLSVRFALHKPDAKGVSLCGEFNGWSPNATSMKRHNDGHWETTVALAPGRYQYKFLADGDWLLDPAAQKNVPNEHGSLNSVIEVLA